MNIFLSMGVFFCDRRGGLTAKMDLTSFLVFSHLFLEKQMEVEESGIDLNLLVLCTKTFLKQ